MSYVRLDTGNRWRKQATPVVNTGFAIKIKYFPVAKAMVHVTGNKGLLRKSINSGRTWTNVTLMAGSNACLDVCEAPDGSIWGLFYDTGTNTAKVGVSTNAMTSWTLKYTHTAGYQAFNIACSPQPAADVTVAFTARNATGIGAAIGTNSELVISTNSGTSFTTKLMNFKLTTDQDEPILQVFPGKVSVFLRGIRIPPLTVAAWSAIATQDFRFVDQWGAGQANPGLGGDGSLNPLTDRGIVVLHSSSADPTLVVSGATSTLLSAYDSDTPANFGGDGHAWWRLYYIEPTAATINFAGTTGVVRNCTFLRNSQNLVSVSRSFLHDLEYHGAQVGTAVEVATASQSTQLGDVLWNYINHYERSIDNLTYEKIFHHSNPAIFNHDFTRVNSAFIPLLPGGGAGSAIDWYVDAENNASSHSIVMVFKGTAVADPEIFPNSVRILVVADTLRLRGLYQPPDAPSPSTFVISSLDGGTNWTVDYQNDSAPLPVELIRYGDVTPLFAVSATPNKILRWNGSWEVFNDPLTVGGEVAAIASLAYDLISNRLFVSYVNSSRIFALLKASEVDVSQANQAVDAAAAVLFDEGVEGYWQIIPNTATPPVTYRQLISNKKARL